MCGNKLGLGPRSTVVSRSRSGVCVCGGGGGGGGGGEDDWLIAIWPEN